MSTHRYVCPKTTHDPRTGDQYPHAVLEISGPHALTELPTCPSCGDPLQLLEHVADPEPEPQPEEAAQA